MASTLARQSTPLDVLLRAGFELATPDPRPAVPDLPAAVADELLELYRALGGRGEAPRLRPGRWDLAFAGLIVELDEEQHFNRYRAATLTCSWVSDLPWAFPYGSYCATLEAACLRAASHLGYWTSPSAARMFVGGPRGDLDGDGSARWKQRALYDALKDAAPMLGMSLARVSVHDRVEGVALGDVLRGDAGVDPRAVRVLVESRTAPSA